ncbi:PAS fold family [Synechococcus sp. PCC 7335]|uniref:PAS domain S-box protein n=1 Tax=Synechococcus sp. (strain ATCC 29403 / PCC 7335) TaxID=91464 RepID=UPI00017ED9E4|nr:PAS domain S-box protein [Synechococcus sp. PCC 7335]EDX83108.1 PAS fold family [Synechococcus sp. PCC 7335]
MKILILESGHSIGHFPQNSSLGDRYELDTARYTEAKSQLIMEPNRNTADYDLIVLDTAHQDSSGLADSNLSGIALCQRLRAQSIETPILLLIDPQDNCEDIAAITADADDYVTKPFDQKTLLTRIAFLLHRERHKRSQQQAQMYQALVETSPNIIERFDTDLRHLYVSPQLKEITGIPVEQFVGKTCRELGLPTSMVDRWESAARRLLSEGQTQTIEFELPTDAGLRYFEMQLAPELTKGKVIQSILCISRDVTTHKQVELALRTQKTKLQGLANNVPDMVHQYILRADGTEAFTYVSAGCRDIWEMEPAALLQNAQRAWSLIHAEDVERVRRMVEAAARDLQPLDFEFRVLPPSGGLRWIRTVSQPERQPNGDMLFNSFMLDVSDRKQAEHRLQKQLDQKRLLSSITDSIHRTLDLDQILKTAVDQVRHLLQTDRVLVFRFNPDWQGIVEAESASADWPATLGMDIKDDCFNEEYAETFRRGRIRTISDVNTTTVDPCYVELLKRVQVRANLVVPILQGDYLWGLLIAHQCAAPRQWQPESIQLLEQVATQLGIALQQAELYQATRRELVERREIQVALQASEARFRALSAFAPVGIYQTDLQGRCIYTNAKWQEIAGITLEESLGDSWGQAIHPDDRERVFTAWNRFVAGESDFSMEFRFFNKFEKEERWVFGRAIAMRAPNVSKREPASTEESLSGDARELPTGEIIGYVGINEDITERKCTERKLREQAALIDIATDAIFVRNLSGQITFWSKGATRLYGWQAEEALGKTAQQLLKKRNGAALQTALTIALEQGFWQGELTQSTKTGQDILVASRWTLVRDEAQQPKFLLEVNTDITEKKQLEAHYYQAQKLESLGQLAGGIAHDLGNILTPILGIAQLLRLTLTDANASTQEQIDILEKSAQRGTKMVRQILTFAQGSPESKTTADISALLQEIVDIVRQGFPSSIEVRLEMSLLEDDPGHKAVAVDSTHLHQVLMNLCVNARDAMPNGGVLTIVLDQVSVTEAAARKDPEVLAGHYMVVTVADTGAGIASEVRDRIFDPFFTTKTPDQGTGLGLATVLGIVRKAGGFLKVLSELGQGTEMEVYLPIVEAQY